MAAISIASLSVEERMQLLDQLWESLSADPGSIPLTATQRDELNWRLDELDRDGPAGIAWEDVVSRIKTRPQ